MKTELLETLLLDRALGELSPEVSALLDAHLARDPAAARRATELTDTFQLARAASAAPPASPRRPLDVERLRRTQRAQRSATRRMEIFRLAACLALGLGLGWLARAPRPPAAIAAVPPPAVSTNAPPPARFWSLARLAAEQAAPTAAAGHRESRYELRWNSTAKMPRVEEKL